MKLSSSFAGILSRAPRLSSFVKAAQVLVRRRLAWLILGGLALGVLGWWVYQAVEEAMHDRMAAELTTIRDADVEALRVWMKQQEANAQILAQIDSVRSTGRELARLADQASSPETDLRVSKALAELRRFLRPRLKVLGYYDFGVVSPSGRMVASVDDAAVGKRLSGYAAEFFLRVLHGEPRVSLPFRSSLLLPDENGELKAGLPTMLAAAPIFDDAGKPVAGLALRIRPEAEFTKILQVARSGRSGETFVFNKGGLLLSQSRFDDDLKRVGLLADQPDARSILTLELRDPEVNMVAGERPSRRRADQPLTRLVASAVQGETGVNLSGFRDYRGVPSLGAWTWLPEYELGVATKVDAAEAYRPLYILRFTFWGLFGLLALSGLALLLFTQVLQRQRKAALLAIKQLGQYTLEEQLGAGGMGTVYRARHAFLRRPTAVKLLHHEQVSATALARFEREVQLTSQLNHPNTVAIYDYGQTPDGVFFYAMEYLDGISLEDLVKQDGPLPEGRAVAILRQICGSLAEAHGIGLIHRDIKPANILLNCRGGQYDFIKVLDFGLVKALHGERETRLTATGAVAGTPLYLAPEAIERPETVDARTDIYAIGAVGYFLLTGVPVFDGETAVEVCLKHLREAPVPPSQRSGKPVSAPLEAVILRCLAKEPADRPATAQALIEALDECELAATWSQADARSWWTQLEKKPTPVPPAPTTNSSEVLRTVAYSPGAPGGA
jgi:eukaryotic-like serine/threonine-protein kinase